MELTCARIGSGRRRDLKTYFVWRFGGVECYDCQDNSNQGEENDGRNPKTFPVPRRARSQVCWAVSLGRRTRINPKPRARNPPIRWTRFWEISWAGRSNRLSKG